MKDNLKAALRDSRPCEGLSWIQLFPWDGYYTSPKNEIDWFEFDKQEVEWSKEINRLVDTMLYGRVTYEEFSQFWPKAKASPGGFDSETIGQLNELRKIVFSRTIKDTPWKPAEVIREEPETAVARLKQESGKDMVVVGSGPWSRH